VRKTKRVEQKLTQPIFLLHSPSPTGALLITATLLCLVYYLLRS